MPNERYGFVSNRQEFAGAMAMSCSLEKKLKELAILKRKKQFVDSGRDMKLDFIKLKPALKELGVVAQKIREIFSERPSHDWMIKNLDKIELVELAFKQIEKDVLGLLVEEGEK